MLRANVIELDNALPISYDKSQGIFAYGKDNYYPQRTKNIINNSTTAKSCVRLMKSYIYGKGFENNDFTLNNLGETPNKFLSKISNSIPTLEGFAIHISYNQFGQKTAFKVIPHEWVRWGKKDDNGFKPFVKVSKDWMDVKKHKPIEYNVYNPRNVLEQIARAGGIDKYKGQVLYASLEDEEIYGQGFVSSSLNDAEAEYQSSVHRINLIKREFMDKMSVITKPFADSKERDKFLASIKKSLGAKEVGGVLHFEVELENDDLSKEIIFEKISANINDKIFSYTDEKVQDQVRKSFLSPHPVLINNTDSGVFGNSGELIRQIKIDYQEKTEYIRLFIEEMLEDLFSNTVNESFNQAEFKIRPLIDVN